MFIQNLEVLSTEPLLTLAAALTEVTTASLVELQVKAWVQRTPIDWDRGRESVDSLLERRIARTREEFSRRQLPDDTLRWMIRQQLAARADKVRARNLAPDGRTLRALAQLGDAELARAVLCRIAPLYQIRVKPATSIDWLEQEIFRRFIRELGERVEKELRTAEKDPAQLEDIEEEIDRRLQTLSRGEREALQRDLGLTRLTGKELRAFAARGGLTTATLAGAASTGMGLYLATTTITHALATTLLGVTLPFAAYTTLTSALSLLVSPVGALVLVGAGGLIEWGKLRRAVDQRVLLHAFVTLIQGGFDSAKAAGSGT